MIILNIICYIITGLVVIDLAITIIICLLNANEDAFYGIKRVIMTDNRNKAFGKFYITPSISFDTYTFEYKDKPYTNKGIEIFIEWLYFGIYICYTKELEQ